MCSERGITYSFCGERKHFYWRDVQGHTEEGPRGNGVDRVRRERTMTCPKQNLRKGRRWWSSIEPRRTQGLRKDDDVHSTCLECLPVEGSESLSVFVSPGPWTERVPDGPVHCVGVLHPINRVTVQSRLGTHCPLPYLGHLFMEERCYKSPYYRV